MTDDVDNPDLIGPLVARGHRPPPPWYNWTIKLMLVIAVLLAVVSLAALIFYLAPTVRNLSVDNADEKEQDACYDQLTADITDGNAAVLASLTSLTGEVGDLVVALAAPERDPAAVAAIVARIEAASPPNAAAIRAYDESIAARTEWVETGRLLPCPVNA